MVKMKPYRDAIVCPNSLQTPFEVLRERRIAGKKRMDALTLTEMRSWLKRSGVKLSDLDKLNIIHIAGTKGKGYTCAFVDSILNQHRRRHGVPRKIGLYTSPHLLSVREGIRFNSKPMEEDLFARYFFEVWDALEASAVRDGRDPSVKPVSFRFLTLLSWHVFLNESVDVAIYEVRVGGAWDSTNIIENPAVTGITKLGIDHVGVLGDTLAKISWHKAGIFKKGVPAVSVVQDPEAAEVLRERAAATGVSLYFVKRDPFLFQIQVVPDAEFQRGNISLAIALVVAAGKKLGISDLYPNILPDVFKDGIEQTVWRGRCEIKIDGPRKWCLDGAHTVDSLKVAAQWFSQQQSGDSAFRILVFNQHKRSEAKDLLGGLQQVLNGLGVHFDHVIFSTNVTRKSKGYRNEFDNRNANAETIQELTVQKGFANVWTASNCYAMVHLAATVQEAVELVEEISEGRDTTEVLVTGSLHLVGGVLAVLEGTSTPALS